MSEKKLVKPVALASAIALAGSFAAISVAQADSGTSPFAMTTLSAGYMLSAEEGRPATSMRLTGQQRQLSSR